MSEAIAPKKEFGKWRSFFWPIHSHELKKVIPMFLMFFFISFVYSALRNVKDALVLTAPGSGAETLLFLKVFGVVPAAIILMLIYAKLSNVLSKEKLFYTTTMIFIGYFLLFALVLYPMRDYIQPYELADHLSATLPAGLGGLIAAFKNWTFSLFYIFAELWGSFVLSLLFWGFANDTTKVTEAKRFYALFGLGANLALYIAGDAIHMVNSIAKGAPAGSDTLGISLNYLMGMSIIAGIIVMLIYRWMNKNVLSDPRFYDPSEQTKVKKEKPKMSIIDSFKFLSKSRYMLYIALLVLSYNIIINLVEITWKSQLKLQYPTPGELLVFNAWYQKGTSIVTILMMLFVTGNVMRRFGWAVAAYITPVVLLITGIGFFTFVIFKDALSPYVVALGVTPLMFAVIFGTIQNIMTKASKYALFDPTKEMAYIPLDQESKVKGKAAIDTVGARLGKAGGSGVQLGLIAIFGSLSVVTPHIAVIMLVIISVWMWAIKGLNETEFKKVEQKGA